MKFLTYFSSFTVIYGFLMSVGKYLNGDNSITMIVIYVVICTVLSTQLVELIEKVDNLQTKR